MQALVNRIWYAKHPISYLLLPLSGLFYLISSLRRRYLQRCVQQTQALPVPVIVVGNITVGGSGKTPMVIYLIDLLRRHGYTPGVISRGYGAKIDGVKVVTINDNALSVGDEPAMIVARTQAPMVVGSNRVAGAKLLLQQGVDVIISDDGLQHYLLPRDIELVIMDGARRFGNEYLLPAGPLREGKWRLDTIDWLINNGGSPEGVPTLAKEVLMQLQPQAMRALKPNSASSWNNDQSVVAIAGIGNPQRFFDTLKRQGISLSETIAFEDHQAFKAEELMALSSGKTLIMTEKDAIKCRDFAQPNWWYLPVDAELTDEFDRRLLARLRGVMLEKQQQEGKSNGI